LRAADGNNGITCCSWAWQQHPLLLLPPLLLLLWSMPRLVGFWSIGLCFERILQTPQSYMDHAYHLRQCQSNPAGALGFIVSVTVRNQNPSGI
jgi:hypothetical protein